MGSNPAKRTILIVGKASGSPGPLPWPCSSALYVPQSPSQTVPIISPAQPVRPFIPGRVLVRFKGTSGIPLSGAISETLTVLLSREQTAASQFIASSGAVFVPVAPGREISPVLALRADQTVEFAEVDGLVKKAGSLVDMTS